MVIYSDFHLLAFTSVVKVLVLVLFFGTLKRWKERWARITPEFLKLSSRFPKDKQIQGPAPSLSPGRGSLRIPAYRTNTISVFTPKSERPHPPVRTHPETQHIEPPDALCSVDPPTTRRVAFGSPSGATNHQRKMVSVKQTEENGPGPAFTLCSPPFFHAPCAHNISHTYTLKEVPRFKFLGAEVMAVCVIYGSQW